MTPRRFPPPWSIGDIGAAYIVKDNIGQNEGHSTGGNFCCNLISAAPDGTLLSLWGTMRLSAQTFEGGIIYASNRSNRLLHCDLGSRDLRLHLLQQERTINAC
jgi:hypothetical protein